MYEMRKETNRKEKKCRGKEKQCKSQGSTKTKNIGKKTWEERQMKVYIAGRIRDVIFVRNQIQKLVLQWLEKVGFIRHLEKMDGTCWTVYSADYSIDIVTSKRI